jgi:hypothetical protein
VLMSLLAVWNEAPVSWFDDARIVPVKTCMGLSGIDVTPAFFSSWS